MPLTIVLDSLQIQSGNMPRLCHYVKSTCNAGLEVYIDADFAGNWNHEEAVNDQDSVQSRHGYIIKYMGKSQLQMEIALS